MRDIPISSRAPLTPTGLAHALKDAAQRANVKRKVLPGMPAYKNQEAELFAQAISDWYRFVARSFSLEAVSAQSITLNEGVITRNALVDMANLRASSSNKDAIIAAALACKRAERQWLKFLDQETAKWTTAMSEDATAAVTRLNKDFLCYKGADAVKVIRHGYGSAANTYWGLVGVVDKIFAARGLLLPSGHQQRDLSGCAKQISLVLSSLHLEHLREVDMTLRGQNTARDYQPNLFEITDSQLLVRQSAALLKPPEVGPTVATGCPATKATVEGVGNVASALLRMFENSYLSLPGRN